MSSSTALIALLLVSAVFVFSDARHYYTKDDVMFSSDAPLGARITGSYSSCVRKLTLFVMSVCKTTEGCTENLTLTGCTRELSVDYVRARCCPDF